MQWAPSLLVPQCTPTFASTFLLPLVSREQAVLGQRQAHSTLSLGSEVSGTPKERRDEARWGVKAKTGGWLGQVPQKQTCSQGSRTVHTGGDANRPGDEQGREGATLFLGGHLDTGGIGRGVRPREEENHCQSTMQLEAATERHPHVPTSTSGLPAE